MMNESISGVVPMSFDGKYWAHFFVFWSITVSPSTSLLLYALEMWAG